MTHRFKLGAADLKRLIDKTQFATDTTAAVGPASLSQGREELCGLSERPNREAHHAKHIFNALFLEALCQ